MQNFEQLHLQLPSHLMATLSEAVANGEYISTNEAATAVFSQWQLRRKVMMEELKILCEQGLSSGTPTEKPISDILAEARRRQKYINT